MGAGRIAQGRLPQCHKKCFCQLCKTWRHLCDHSFDHKVQVFSNRWWWSHELYQRVLSRQHLSAGASVTLLWEVPCSLSSNACMNHIWLVSFAEFSLSISNEKFSMGKCIFYHFCKVCSNGWALLITQRISSEVTHSFTRDLSHPFLVEKIPSPQNSFST